MKPRGQLLPDLVLSGLVFRRSQTAVDLAERHYRPQQPVLEYIIR